MKIGAAFGDHIRTEKISRRHFDPDKPRTFRLFLLVVLLILFPCILLFKLVSLQLVHGAYYRVLSDSNRTRTYVIHAPRGVIFDRNGEPLVYNIPGFREVKNGKATLISREKAIDLLSRGKNQLEIDSLRNYPLKNSAAHVVGYVGQITKEELGMPEYSNYNSTDSIGKTGIEHYYEHVLRGIDGKQLTEVDAMGKNLRVLGQSDPIPGKDITLTIDNDLQQTADSALPPDKKGSVVVSTPDGEILALVSHPSFDPNLFTMDQTYVATDSAYQSVSAVLLDSNNQPLLNRAIAGTYPPGSTFKLITAVAGLADNTIDEKYTVDDTGIIHVGTFSFANWFYLENGKTDGIVNVVKAIARSNDIFFYKLAEKVGVDKVSAIAAKFGVGSVLGIDLHGEQKGILPTKTWKQSVLHEPWYLGDTYHYGIGQGYLLTTPLQVNMWTAALANNGVLPMPHLLKAAKREAKTIEIIDEKNIALIRQGMIESCSPGGVAWPLFKFKVQNEKLQVDGKNILDVKVGSESAGLKELQKYKEITVACKTGTAQHGDETTEPHAWITLFAPAYDPQIVVTVLVESGGQGSTVAAPVAKKVLEEWFGR
jgi:penicillin-binding protein 2